MKTAQPAAIVTRRIYDDAREAGEYRVLVDRLWPRGVARASADLDEWLKDAAPSTELRRWFHRDPARWHEFCDRYRAELAANAGLLHDLLVSCGERSLVLLYAARDAERNHARVLAEEIAELQTRM